MKTTITLTTVIVKITVVALVIIPLIALIIFQPNIYEFFGTRTENATSNIMQNNITYIRGKCEYLTRLKLEYVKTKDNETKQALKEVYIQELSTIDNSKLPVSLLNIEN